MRSATTAAYTLVSGPCSLVDLCSDLTARAVVFVLKRRAARAVLALEQAAGHSLRAGFVTSAAAACAPERGIAERTSHTGTAMLRRYMREGSLFRENALGAVGL